MLTVYRADLPRTLALAVAPSLAVPAMGFVVREFHSPNSQITIAATLDRKPLEATRTTVCGNCRREPPIANSIDRLGRVE
jgi:hypothetical protein